MRSPSLPSTAPDSALDDDALPRVVEGDDGKFDPRTDYYAVLDVSNASSAKEITAAYRKTALSLHPDKFKNESSEQQQAIAKKFQALTKAYRVLLDEEMRAAYDKCRDYMAANPDKTSLPTLTPEEQALVMRWVLNSQTRRTSAASCGVVRSCDRSLVPRTHSHALTRSFVVGVRGSSLGSSGWGPS